MAENDFGAAEMELPNQKVPSNEQERLAQLSHIVRIAVEQRRLGYRETDHYRDLKVDT